MTLKHSLISKTNKAPLQESFSEALPTPARLKGTVFRCKTIVGDKVSRKRWRRSPPRKPSSA